METGPPVQEHTENVPYPVSLRQLNHPLAIASLICGLLFFLPLIPAVLAIVFGFMARSRIAKNPEYRGSGMALAGIILGFLYIAGVLVSIPALLEMQQARNRFRCASNLRQICMATHMYTNDDKRRAFPPDPMLLNKYMRQPDVWICPQCQQAVADDGVGRAAGSYIYLGEKLGPSVYKIRKASTTILAYEPLSNHGGRGFNAVYLDGHCDWIPKEQAEAVMQQIKLSMVPTPAK